MVPSGPVPAFFGKCCRVWMMLLWNCSRVLCSCVHVVLFGMAFGSCFCGKSFCSLAAVSGAVRLGCVSLSRWSALDASFASASIWILCAILFFFCVCVCGVLLLFCVLCGVCASSQRRAQFPLSADCSRLMVMWRLDSAFSSLSLSGAFMMM